MPNDGKNKTLNKELIRNFSGKYEDGGAGFFIGQMSYDGGTFFDFLHPEFTQLNFRGQPEPLSASGKLSGLITAAFTDAPFHPERIKGDAAYEYKTKLTYRRGADVRSLNEGWDLLQDMGKRADDYMKGLDQHGKAFLPFLKLNLRHVKENSDFINGYLDNPYLIHLHTIVGGGPKIIYATGENGQPLKKDGLPVVDWATMESNLRGPNNEGPLEPLMGLFTAANDLWDREIEKQQMLRNGYTPEEEKAYLENLKGSFDGMITAFDKAVEFEKKNPGKWDKTYLNNEFDHITNVSGKQTRGIRPGIGMMKGQRQAIENGWGMDELEVLGFVGEQLAGAEMDARTMELSIRAAEAKLKEERENPGASPESIAAKEKYLQEWKNVRPELQEYREKLEKLRDEIWDKKVASVEDKKEILKKVEDFRNETKDLHTSRTNTVAEANQVLEKPFARIRAKLDNPQPALTFDSAAAARRQGFIDRAAQAEERLAQLREEKEEQFRDFDPYPDAPGIVVDPDVRAEYFAYQEEAAQLERRILHGKLAEKLTDVADVRATERFFDTLTDEYELSVENGELKIGKTDDPHPETLPARLDASIQGHDYDNKAENLLKKVRFGNMTTEEKYAAAGEYAWNRFSARRIEEMVYAGYVPGKLVSQPAHVDTDRREDPLTYVRELEAQATASGDYRDYVREFTALVARVNKNDLTQEQIDEVDAYKTGILQKEPQFLRGFGTELARYYLETQIAQAHASELLAEDIRAGKFPVDEAYEPIRKDYKASRQMANGMVDTGYGVAQLSGADELKYMLNDQVNGFGELAHQADQDYMANARDGMSKSRRARYLKEATDGYTRYPGNYGMDVGLEGEILHPTKDLDVYKEFMKNLDSLQNFGTELSKITKDAQEKLDRLNELKAYKSDNSPQFLRMCTALEEVSALTFNDSSGKIERKLELLGDASKAYAAKIRGTTFAGIRRNGRLRLEMADELSEFAAGKGQTLMNIRKGAVDRKGSLSSQLETASRNYLDIDNKLKERYQDVYPGCNSDKAIADLQKKAKALDLKADNPEKFAEAKEGLAACLAEIIAARVIRSEYDNKTWEDFIITDDFEYEAKDRMAKNEADKLKPEKIQEAVAGIRNREDFRKMMDSATTPEALEALRQTAIMPGGKALVDKLANERRPQAGPQAGHGPNAPVLGNAEIKNPELKNPQLGNQQMNGPQH